MISLIARPVKISALDPSLFKGPVSVGLAVLASEYPDQFVRIREELPSYVRQGTRFLDLAIRIGSRIEELADRRAAQAFEELGEY